MFSNYNYFVNGSEAGRLTNEDIGLCETLTAILDTESFVTIPLNYQRGVEGRLFLSARYRFTIADLQFLLQVTAQLLPILENIRLVDQMASEAAEMERQRIALDIHDNLIQPYIGLKLRLASVYHKLITNDASAISDVERLRELTNIEIADLRRYVSALRNGVVRHGSLPLAIERFAAKFTEATQIEVLIEVEDPIKVSRQIPDRLAAEVFQIVVEGLNNVRRHTQAAQAMVRLACHSDRLIVRIENEDENDAAPVSFTPRSITERAQALGGQAHVERDAHRRTLVTVKIPL